MPLLFAMSLAGSISLTVGLCILLCRKVDTNFYYANSLFKLSVFLLLLPVQLVKNLFPVPANLFTVKNNYMYVLSFKNKFQLQLHSKTLFVPFWLLYLFLFIMCSVLLFCIYEYKNYRTTCRTLLKTSTPFDFQEHFCIYRNPFLTTPCTIGFLKTYILFPDNDFSDIQSEMLYIHETTHIKNKDSIFKFLCAICLCLHWYNPIIWTLLPLYSYSAECMCDYNVIQLFSSETERRIYASLLLDISTTKLPLPQIWKNNFSTSKKILKRRIIFIMKTNSQTKKSLIFATLLLFSILIIPVTTYAYTPLEQTSEFLVSENTVLTEEITTLTEEIPPKYIDCFNGFVDFSSSNESIVFEDETTFHSLDYSLTESSRVICKHTYKSGHVYTHSLNKKGGCVITCYSAKICTKCNLKKDMVKVSTTTYVKCIH